MTHTRSTGPDLNDFIPRKTKTASNIVRKRASIMTNRRLTTSRFSGDNVLIDLTKFSMSLTMQPR
jgi:hypothetical protein